MAVQSPHPAEHFLPDLLRRVRSAEMKTVLSSNLIKGADDTPSSPRLHVSQAPVTAYQQQTVKSKVGNGSEAAASKMNRLKRTWEAACADDPLMVKGLASSVLPFNAVPVFTGLRLATSSPLTDNSAPPQTSTSSFHAPDFSASLRACMDKHADDVFLLVDAQANAMKQAMEEKRALHSQALMSLMEDHVVKRLKKKDEEFDRMRLRTLELEEGLKQVSLELQLWKNLARNNELMALNLRQNLEQVVVQMREQKHQYLQAGHGHFMSREEGCGESEVDDAVSSCQYRHSRDGKDQRRCKFCGVNNACVLLLPCRHLCLCLECAGHLDKCPLCGIIKNASLQVFT